MYLIVKEKSWNNWTFTRANTKQNWISQSLLICFSLKLYNQLLYKYQLEKRLLENNFKCVKTPGHIKDFCIDQNCNPNKERAGRDLKLASPLLKAWWQNICSYLWQYHRMSVFCEGSRTVESNNYEKQARPTEPGVNRWGEGWCWSADIRAGSWRA